MKRNIGNSILPANNSRILEPLSFKRGELRVCEKIDEDAHSLIFSTKNEEYELACHPNGFSCFSLAEKIVSGDKLRSLEQADYIERCGGEVNRKNIYLCL